MNFIFMLLEAHHTIQASWYGEISCWKISFPAGKTDAISVKLIRSYAQIVQSFHGLFYNN